MIPMFAVGSFIAAAIAAPFSFNGPSLNGENIAILLFWGGLVSPVCLCHIQKRIVLASLPDSKGKKASFGPLCP